MVDTSSLKYDKDNKYHRLFRKCSIIFLSLVVFVLLWWNVSLVIHTAAIPTPFETFDAFINLFVNGASPQYTMWDHIFASLERFMIGFVLALIVAIPFGLLLGYSNTLREFSSPALEVLRPIAPIAWAPVFLFAVGAIWAPIFVVFIGILFPLLTNTMFGVKKIDPNMIDASRTMGATKLQTFYKVVFPASTPYIMNGMRIGLGIGWMCIVAAEMYAPYGGGIGYFISLQAANLLWPNVFAGIIVIAILGILTTGVADYIYRRISKRTGLE
jgi:ABC-type nitrate/sulfonate/bicarbonate transport system, permease component